MTAALSWANC